MNARRRILAHVVVILAFFGVFSCSRSSSAEHEALLAVAASLRVAMPDLVKAYAAKHPGVTIVPSYGSSGELEKQVEGGAPIDGVLFASANPVDSLIKAGRVEATTRVVIATNQLVLIGPKGAKPLTFDGLASLGPDQKLAIGDPGAVPAGQYAREVLEKKGVYGGLQGRIVLGNDVAAVLAYARRGEVAAAIVYRTDMLGIADVALLDEAKGDWAPRAEVVIGIVKGSKGEAGARSFFAFLASEEARAILSEHGFGPP